jgi:hypothetical protein
LRRSNKILLIVGVLLAAVSFVAVVTQHDPLITLDR